MTEAIKCNRCGQFERGGIGRSKSAEEIARLIRPGAVGYDMGFGRIDLCRDCRTSLRHEVEDLMVAWWYEVERERQR